MPSNRLILCRPHLLLPSSFPSIRVFSNESALHIRWPKYWSFHFNISPTNEHPELISFRKDWLDLLAVQGTLKSLLQHHSSKASFLPHSAFFIVQLSHPYTTIGKTTVLTRWTFVDKVMHLLFSMLSRLVITFLPRSKRLLISWLQSPSAVILDHFQFALIHAPNIPGSNAILLFIALNFTSITSYIHNWVLFLLWLWLFFLSGAISPLICSSILGTYRPGEFISRVLSFCLFIVFMGFSRQEYWNGLPLPSPLDHVLSDLSTMPRPSWVAPHGMA